MALGQRQRCEIVLTCWLQTPLAKVAAPTLVCNKRLRRLCPEHEQYQVLSTCVKRNFARWKECGCDFWFRHMHCTCCMHDQLACKCKVPPQQHRQIFRRSRRVSHSGVDTSAQQIFLTTRKKATGREAANSIHVARGRGQWLAISCMPVRTSSPVIHAALKLSTAPIYGA